MCPGDRPAPTVVFALQKRVAARPPTVSPRPRPDLTNRVDVNRPPALFLLRPSNYAVTCRLGRNRARDPLGDNHHCSRDRGAGVSTSPVGSQSPPPTIRPAALTATAAAAEVYQPKSKKPPKSAYSTTVLTEAEFDVDCQFHRSPPAERPARCHCRSTPGARRRDQRSLRRVSPRSGNSSSHPRFAMMTLSFSCSR